MGIRMGTSLNINGWFPSLPCWKKPEANQDVDRRQQISVSKVSPGTCTPLLVGGFPKWDAKKKWVGFSLFFHHPTLWATPHDYGASTVSSYAAWAASPTNLSMGASCSCREIQEGFRSIQSRTVSWTNLHSPPWMSNICFAVEKVLMINQFPFKFPMMHDHS